MTITIDGVCVSVIPASVAAARMGYTVRYVCLLCDTGKLIACKISGQWLVAERAAKLYPQKDTAYYPFAG